MRRAIGWRDRFLTYWTLKEAYLKARGLGISVPLSDISFTVDGDREARIAFRTARSPARTTAGRFICGSPRAHHLAGVAADAADGVRPAFTVQPF